jgi:hypothetical protein
VPVATESSFVRIHGLGGPVTGAEAVYRSDPRVLNAAGVSLTGFEHLEMLADVGDRLCAGFSERETRQIRYRESQRRGVSADRPTVS